MYLDFFRLEREPFHITPDPFFFYLSPSHKEAFASLIYGLKKRKGFVAVIGEIGLGKTTVLRTFLQHKSLKDKIKTIFVFNSNISFKGLLKVIYSELGYPLPTPEQTSSTHPRSQTGKDPDEIFDLVQGLHEILINEYQAGNNLVLVIDEAQNMPVSTLENLRMLSNLETAKDKLLQIFLIGQPELKATLERPELRQLKQRIAIWVTLSPLSHGESIDYINFRLKKAGLRGDNPFTTQALQKIAAYCQGTPRKLNILCDNALISAFGGGQKKVSLKIVNAAIADLESKALHRQGSTIIRAAVITLLAVILTLVLVQPVSHPLIPRSISLTPQGQRPAVDLPDNALQDQSSASPLPPLTNQPSKPDSGSDRPPANDPDRSGPDTGSPTPGSGPKEVEISSPDSSQAAKPEIPKSTPERHKTGDQNTSHPLQPETRGHIQGTGPLLNSKYILPPLDQEGYNIHSQLISLLAFYKELSTVRQYVLIEMAKQTSINGLLTFNRMFSALEKRDYHLAARQMVFSHWARRVGQPAFALAKTMQSGKIKDFIHAKSLIRAPLAPAPITRQAEQ